MTYRYEIRITAAGCCCPYQVKVLTSSGLKIGDTFVFSVGEGRRKATAMAKKHASGRAGTIVDSGEINVDLRTPFWKRWFS